MLTTIIPAYPYVQYNDDTDVSAFFTAYNQIAQQYLDSVNDINLPIYTKLSGDLLDWVGTGLYGIPRPALNAGLNGINGTLGSFTFGDQTFGNFSFSGPSTVYVTTDDIYQRCITWQFYKGDGTQFSIPWLKRRIMRFLFGENGVDYGVNETFPVSVTFGAGNLVVINLGAASGVATGGAIFGEMTFGDYDFSDITATITPGYAIPTATILAEGILSGVLPLPFQYTYQVNT